MDIPFDVTLPPGVITNDSPYAVKGRYVDSKFVRPYQGKMQKWAGWGNYLGLTTGGEPARGGLIWNTNDGTTLTVFGTASRLYLYKQGVRYDINPQGYSAGLVDAAPGNTGWGDGGWGDGPWGGGWTSVAGQGAFPRVWTMGRWGQDLIACPRGQPIYTWIYGTGVSLGIATTAISDNYAQSLLQFEGTDTSTTFTDENAAGSSHIWTAHGDAQIDTADFKFGAASGLFDGTGDYIDTPDHVDFNLASNNFTIDFWFKCNAAGGTVKK